MLQPGEYAGIVYTTVGSAVDYLPGQETYPLTLEEYIFEKLHISDGADDIEKALNVLYNKVLKGLYRHRDEKEFDLGKKYGAVLPPSLTLTKACVSKDNSKSDLSGPLVIDIIKHYFSLGKKSEVTIEGNVIEVDNKSYIKLTEETAEEFTR